MHRQLSFSRLLLKLRRQFLAFYQRCRVLQYQFISDAENTEISAALNQPVLLSGQGRIVLKKCNLGVWPSPYYLSGYTHIEARSAGSEVIIGNGVVINNNAVIIAEKTFIKIGDDTLIGSEFNVYDSDFHGLHPDHRNSGNHLSAGVSIGENVFIGSRVTVLKGVAIGNNSVIANGSIVNMDVPANVIAGGVPIRIIREI
jgi:maltose O-acetyltransferase